VTRDHGLPRLGPATRMLLHPPALLYRGVVHARNALYDAGWWRGRRLDCPVVSIGNLTVGGTGKTPLTSHAAAVLRDAGYRVGVLSRGYGRRGGGAAVLVSDGRTLLQDASIAGDEPYLIARDNPAVQVAVGANREAAARLLWRAGAPEVVLLDDGFQHRALGRDLDLLLLDAADPLGNGRMLPFGPLREPPCAVSRADAVVLTRSDGHCPPALTTLLQRHNPEAAIFHARIEPLRFVRPDGQAVALNALRGFAAFALSGIARPDRFEADLERLGLRLVGTRRHPDHRRFSARDLEEAGQEARRRGAEVMVTTEKDMVRILWPPAAVPPLYALAQRLSFPSPPGLDGWLLDRLQELRRHGGWKRDDHGEPQS
jgi:tetraacyldisaccharide 4'-kinase